MAPDDKERIIDIGGLHHHHISGLYPELRNSVHRLVGSAEHGNRPFAWREGKPGTPMRHLTAALCLAMVGCATYARSSGALPPGYGVSDDLAISSCGSLEDFRERVDGYNRMYQDAYDRGDPIPLGGLIPRIGQTDCDVLAMLGVPDDTTLIQGATYLSASWTYMTGEGVTRRAHIVTFDADGDHWVVASIAW